MYICLYIYHIGIALFNKSLNSPIVLQVVKNDSPLDGLDAGIIHKRYYLVEGPCSRFLSTRCPQCNLFILLTHISIHIYKHTHTPRHTYNLDTSTHTYARCLTRL